MPRGLVICPPPILSSYGEFTFFAEMFSGGREKSLRMAPYYEAVAKAAGASFLDAGKVIETSAHDGIHLDADMQGRLGKAVAEVVRGMVG